jgi:putative transposase
MRMDNGPELISLALAQWAEDHGVMLEFIKPGKPTQNAFIECFNRTYRTEILDFYLFRTLNEAREITERWLNEYNSERPHESLNNLTPTVPADGRKPGSLKKCVELKQVCLQLLSV